MEESLKQTRLGGVIKAKQTTSAIQPMPLSPMQLAELIDGQAAALRLWAGSRCGAAEDVVQEAFCRLAAQDPPPANPVGWLYRVCRNLAEKQRLADSRRRRREQVQTQRRTIAAETADPLELAEMVAAVEGLDTELWEVLVARIWGQLSLAEIGQLCGI